MEQKDAELHRLRAEIERLRAALRSAPNPSRMVGSLDAYVDWYFTERLSALATEQFSPREGGEMTTAVAYDDLPEQVRAHLAALATFIGDCDGRSTVIWSSDGESCVDDGTLDAEDAVKAFNGLVAYLRETR